MHYSLQLYNKQIISHPSYIKMILEAIAKQSYFGKAISRPAIANYIKANYKVGENNAFFNVSLRKALQDGIAKGLLQYGETVSRFKLNDAGRKQLNSKKKIGSCF